MAVMTKTPPRSTRVAQDLLAAIASGRLRPGDPIDLPELCRRHRVSRTVVREALAELEGKGLVLARPGIGTEVANETTWALLDPSLLAEMVRQGGANRLMDEARALRRAVEPIMAAYAARAASRTERATILGVLRQIASAVGAQHRSALPSLDEQFHQAIGAACGNRLLRSLDQSLSPLRAGQCQLLRSVESTDPSGLTSPHSLIAIQTALALAIVRSEPVAAASWALELASVHSSSVATHEHQDDLTRALDSEPDTRSVGLQAENRVAAAFTTPRQDSSSHTEADWPPTITMQFEADGFDEQSEVRSEPAEPRTMTLRIPILRELVGRRSGRDKPVSQQTPWR